VKRNETMGTDTTIPPIDGPATVDQDQPTTDECLTDAGAIPEGQWRYVEPDEAEGTTTWGVMPCARLEPPAAVAVEEAVAVVPVVKRELPETGAEPWQFAAIALILVLFGSAIRRLNQRNAQALRYGNPR
jgi:hypothetical protein